MNYIIEIITKHVYHPAARVRVGSERELGLIYANSTRGLLAAAQALIDSDKAAILAALGPDPLEQETQA